MEYNKRKPLLLLAGLFLVLCGVVAAGYPLAAELLFRGRQRKRLKTTKRQSCTKKAENCRICMKGHSSTMKLYIKGKRYR